MWRFSIGNVRLNFLREAIGISLTWKGLSPKELQGLAPNKLWDGWILGDGDRVPALGPQFGLILLPVRKVRKGKKE
jgi:hypothetical protein